MTEKRIFCICDIDLHHECLSKKQWKKPIAKKVPKPSAVVPKVGRKRHRGQFDFLKGRNFKLVTQSFSISSFCLLLSNVTDYK